MLKKYLILVCAVFLLGFFWIGWSSAEEITYDDGGWESAWTWTAAGYEWAVCFTPTSYPCSVKKAKFYVLTPICSFKVHVRKQASANDQPGIDIITSFLVTPSVGGWYEVNILEDATITSGNFAIGMEYSSALGCPFIGFDLTPPISNLSWVYDFPVGNWVRVGDAVENANIMIRAVVDYPTTTTTTAMVVTTIPFTTTITTGCPSSVIYGEYSEETELLRYFRDEILSKTPEGQELIKLYYEWGPTITRVMEEDEAFKEEVKEIIDGILQLIITEVE